MSKSANHSPLAWFQFGNCIVCWGNALHCIFSDLLFVLNGVELLSKVKELGLPNHQKCLMVDEVNLH